MIYPWQHFDARGCWHYVQLCQTGPRSSVINRLVSSAALMLLKRWVVTTVDIHAQTVLVGPGLSKVAELYLRESAIVTRRVRTASTVPPSKQTPIFIFKFLPTFPCPARWNAVSSARGDDPEGRVISLKAKGPALPLYRYDKFCRSQMRTSGSGDETVLSA